MEVFRCSWMSALLCHGISTVFFCFAMHEKIKTSVVERFLSTRWSVPEVCFPGKLALPRFCFCPRQYKKGEVYIISWWAFKWIWHALFLWLIITPFFGTALIFNKATGLFFFFFRPKYKENKEETLIILLFLSFYARLLLWQFF